MYGTSPSQQGWQGEQSGMGGYYTGGAMSGRGGQGTFDSDYHQWREQHMQALDDDYQTWRRERFQKFSDEFNQWRNTRQSQASMAQRDESSTPRGGSSGSGSYGSGSSSGLSSSGSSTSGGSLSGSSIDDSSSAKKK